MGKDKLDFNEIIKRSGASPSGKERTIPSELYQCVIFFARPVKEEILENNHPLLPKRKWWGLRKKDYETIAAIDEAMEQQKFIFPFYSPEVFTNTQEAERFIPIFVKRLISEGKLPNTVINEDRSLNDNQVEAGIASLRVSFLESDKPEFRE